MSNAHRYKQRSYDEADEWKRSRCHAELSTILSAVDFTQPCADMRRGGAVLGDGNPSPAWRDKVGFELAPDGYRHAEPYVRVQILISRDRNSRFCIVDWKPGRGTRHPELWT